MLSVDVEGKYCYVDNLADAREARGRALAGAAWEYNRLISEQGKLMLDEALELAEKVSDLLGSFGDDILRIIKSLDLYDDMTIAGIGKSIKRSLEKNDPASEIREIFRNCWSTVKVISNDYIGHCEITEDRKVLSIEETIRLEHDLRFFDDVDYDENVEGYEFDTTETINEMEGDYKELVEETTGEFLECIEDYLGELPTVILTDINNVLCSAVPAR